MDAETAKALIDAMNRLTAALQGLQSPGVLGGGLHVYHHDTTWRQPQPQYLQPAQWPTYSPAYSGGQ